jgi:dolichol kinase
MSCWSTADCSSCRVSCMLVTCSHRKVHGQAVTARVLLDMQTLEGALAFVLAAALGSIGCCAFFNATVHDADTAWCTAGVLRFAALASVVGALAETLPTGTAENADNLLIPLSSIIVGRTTGF